MKKLIINPQAVILSFFLTINHSAHALDIITGADVIFTVIEEAVTGVAKSSMNDEQDCHLPDGSIHKLTPQDCQRIGGSLTSSDK